MIDNRMNKCIISSFAIKFAWYGWVCVCVLCVKEKTVKWQRILSLSRALSFIHLNGIKVTNFIETNKSGREHKQAI